MPSRTEAYGRELRAIGHARFEPWIALVLIAFAAVFAWSISRKWHLSSTTDLVVGIGMVVFLVILAIAYCAKDRSGKQLILFEHGLWHAVPRDGGTFIPWHEIKSVSIRGGRNTCLVIVPYDIGRYWNDLSLLQKINRFFPRYVWKSHICWLISHRMDARPKEILHIVRAQLDRSRLRTAA